MIIRSSGLLAKANKSCDFDSDCPANLGHFFVSEQLGRIDQADHETWVQYDSNICLEITGRLELIRYSKESLI